MDEIEPWTGTAYTRYVTLMGQDWNMSYINPRIPAIVGAAEATLIEGVVAVFEKTIRLDVGSTF